MTTGSLQPSATPLGEAVEGVRRLGRALSTVRTPQLKSRESRAHLKAVALSWFRSHRQAASAASAPDLADIDRLFKDVLRFSDMFPSTQKARAVVKQLQAKLRALDNAIVSAPPTSAAAEDAPPSFLSVPDPLMRQVLLRRWEECVACLAAGVSGVN